MESVPKHIAIIMDGNRRFARQLMMKPWKGHEWGREKVEKLLDWCKDLKVHEVTLYAFSIDNFQRPKKEFDYLMKIFKEAAEQLLVDRRIDDYRVKVRFIGRIDMFPQEITSIMRRVMEKTKGNESFIINFAMAYGGRQEIIDAVRLLGKDIEDGKVSADAIDEHGFERYLYMKDEPDMIIRTGGETRLSNFLMWQAHYAELFFVEKTWPEFEKEDLVKCIEEFKARDRRFGR